jgi:hypothetical protein
MKLPPNFGIQAQSLRVSQFFKPHLGFVHEHLGTLPALGRYSFEERSPLGHEKTGMSIPGAWGNAQFGHSDSIQTKTRPECLEQIV